MVNIDMFQVDMFMVNMVNSFNGQGKYG
jgi:hypothetical protein